MPILPLPQFEKDLAEDAAIYERLRPPTSIVVRFGAMKMVGEFPYDGSAKPGCGSKMVVRTHRGVELGEMLTSTCPNAGCSKSVTRKEMLDYIENSGGRDYPFFNQGKVLRIATTEDLNEQARLDATKKDLLNAARQANKELNLPIKIVEAEPILSGDRVTFFFASEERIDFRDLVGKLANICRARIDMRQIGARDEARLTADYERCGQHCCCKQFLKVLKPVSMRSAKVQKATLDPLKISGRCGRLMCCLRYEDQTYSDLAKRLPRKKWRVETLDGQGFVVDTQILTQLVLVRLDKDGTEAAYPLEDLTVLGPGHPSGSGAAPDSVAPAPGAPPSQQPRPRDELRDRPPPQPVAPADEPLDDDCADGGDAPEMIDEPPMDAAPPASPPRAAPSDASGEPFQPGPPGGPISAQPGAPGGPDGGGGWGGGRRRRKRRRRRRGGGGQPGGGPPGGGPGGFGGDGGGGGGGPPPRPAA